MRGPQAETVRSANPAKHTSKSVRRGCALGDDIMGGSSCRLRRVYDAARSGVTRSRRSRLIRRGARPPRVGEARIGANRHNGGHD